MASDKRIILITGANNGIGFDSSYALAAASPNNHIIMGVRTMSKGETAIKEIQTRKPQGTLSLVQLDISDDESITAAAQQLASEFGRIDVLVNNAGIVVKGPPSRDSLRATFETNVYGPMLLTQAIIPLVQKSKDPRIINVSSTMGSIGLRTDPTWAHYKQQFDVYRMSKSAMNMMSACQYFQHKDWGCKVWAYCPGFVVTDLTGREDRQRRIDNGAESSETSAQGILEIVEGKRDGEVNQFVERYGKVAPW
ncbi:NAD(P)-binding protein [Lindgomyces ingoldianus]|uniref:NAD(P)-binding protein n=1 Tax=Lindgomyces ingoldianus TaxID=673940 RepID=A0ACB6QUF8_9PLEO|nr:NAD(P)-binding protein [Lindgomyces ingoldianus]KAF2469717.1 NAD(P)-binding protein [Lindgomyces ingoldianus]